MYIHVSWYKINCKLDRNVKHFCLPGINSNADNCFFTTYWMSTRFTESPATRSHRWRYRSLRMTKIGVLKWILSPSHWSVAEESQTSDWEFICCMHSICKISTILLTSASKKLIPALHFRIMLFFRNTLRVSLKFMLFLIHDGSTS